MLKALWTSNYVEKWNEYFNERFEVTRAGLNLTNRHESILQGQELTDACCDKDVLILGFEKITMEVLKNSPKLKVILSERDGPEENIDVSTCTKMGIPVISAAGRCAQSVAELNILQMLALSRNLIPNSSKVRNGGWEKADDRYENFVLDQKTLSIIGFGRNGRALATIAHGFNMEILTYDPYVSDETAKELGVIKVSLDEAMIKADYVAILARVTAETMGMIGKREISLMKSTAYLVNAGRSALTDENAIFEALRNNKIKGVALDVFGKEPLCKSVDEFIDIPETRLLLTPHIGGMSDRRIQYQYEYMTEGYEKFIIGEKSIRINNPNVFDSPEFPYRGGLMFGSEKQNM